MNKLFKSAISSIALITTLAYVSPVYAISNKENIYSKLDAYGNSYKTIVTEKENEETKQEESEKDLPLEAKISYKLDGKEIKPEELAGKSGRVSIKIEYKNKSEKLVTINGKKEKMFTPFLVAIGTIIDNKSNKNIEVSNGGKIIENGEKSIVVGMVLPGLEESLNLDGELADIEIPSSIEITMDSTNFEMKNILTYANPKIFTQDINWSKFDKLFDKVNELQSGADKIEDGANTLNKGIGTLKDGATNLSNGASKINEGANSLGDGIDSLKAGTNTLNNGANTLSHGTSDLSNGASEVNNGAKSLNTGIKDLEKGLQSAGTGIETLKDGSNEVAKGASTVDAGANTLKTGLESLGENTKKLETGAEQISGAVALLSKNLSEANTKVKGLQSELKKYVGKVDEIQQLIAMDEKYMAQAEDETEKAIWQQNITALKGELDLLNKASSIDELVTGLDKISTGSSELNERVSVLPKKTSELNEGINELIKGATSLTNGTKQLSQGANSLNSGASTLAHGAAKLNEGASVLSKGSDVLASGTKTLAIGASNLNSGASSLAKGTKELVTGVNTLSEGSKVLQTGTKSLEDGTIILVDGTTKIQDGSKELTKGIHEFNVEGIKKISNFVNGNLSNLELRAKKLEELSKEYDSFFGDKKRDEIGFISIVDSIREKNNEKKEK